MNSTAMISAESHSVTPHFLLISWACSLVIVLYLGVFRSFIDRIRAGLSTLQGGDSKSIKLLTSLLSQPNHTRPFFAESGFFFSSVNYLRVFLYPIPFGRIFLLLKCLFLICNCFSYRTNFFRYNPKISSDITETKPPSKNWISFGASV